MEIGKYSFFISGESFYTQWSYHSEEEAKSSLESMASGILGNREVARAEIQQKTTEGTKTVKKFIVSGNFINFRIKEQEI